MSINADTKTPLIANYQPQKTLVYFADGTSLTQQQFVMQVQALAKKLPNNKYCINFCQQRYHFLLLFCANIVRGIVNVLPVNAQAASAQNLLNDYDDIVCVSDAKAIDAVAYKNIQSLLDQEDASDASMPEFAADQTIAIAYTSGSTGKPKANLKTWGLLSGTAKLLAKRLLAGETTLLATVPAQHMYGLETSIMMTLQGQASLYCGASFYAEDIRHALSQVQQCTLVSTPLHLQTIARAALELTGVNKIISATAPLLADTRKMIESALYADIEEIYGFTEAGSVATRQSNKTEQWTLLDGMQIQQASDYFDITGPQLSEARRVSDVVELIDAQHFTLLGRDSDLLNVAGKRASLADLNQRLQMLAGVEDAILFMPKTQENTQKNHQRPAALIVSKRSKREILAEFSQHIDGVFVPRPLIFVEQIPRNATGKVPLIQLQAVLDSYLHHARK